MKLEEFPQLVVEVVREEAAFLGPYESNWPGVLGLPGRREPHLVAAVAIKLRMTHDIRSVLEDSFYGCPDTRCDLVFPVAFRNTTRWVWTEFKTMPIEDANDKLASVHGDLAKLDRAAECDPRGNLPQAMVVLAYDTAQGAFGDRLRAFAQRHSLDRWPVRAAGPGGVIVEPQAGHLQYPNLVVGVWCRYSASAAASACDGTCHLVRRAQAGTPDSAWSARHRRAT